MTTVYGRLGLPQVRRALPVLQDQYTFAQCKAPLPLSLLQKTGVPMPAELTDVVEAAVEWEEFKVGAIQHVAWHSWPESECTSLDVLLLTYYLGLT